MVRVTLNVVGGKADRQQIELILPAVIGRGADADLVIPHPEISRHHCRLFVHQNLVHIQDLHSLNGTMVGEKRLVNAQSVILPGECFSLGPIAFEIQYAKIDTASVTDSQDSPSSSRSFHSASGVSHSASGVSHSTSGASPSSAGIRNGSGISHNGLSNRNLPDRTSGSFSSKQYSPTDG